MSETGLSCNTDCRVAIVGPNHFQNTLLATFIENYSTCSCCIMDSLDSFILCHQENFPCRIALLYDCFHQQQKALSDALQLDLRQLPCELSLVLFNLDRQTRMEKQAIEVGVQGIFYAEDSVQTVLKGLAAIFEGGLWISRQMMTEVILEHGFAHRRRKVVAHDMVQHSLTHREVEILGLLSSGATNKCISDTLFISPHTVRTHLNNIFRKINVSSRLEAAVWAADSLFLPQYRN
ncbi:response regulator transcription factor [Geomonas subterranea]|uniref:Response regulator transcription factor n=1 Tax=Geomonas subterranea TaxID=2847989 RepID=A0ABX8LB27_9BACT|nr:response regulator transcription factor [Geomonas subterranea]QXE89208.1 response regulator transcription factor [Geomonas subterranea]QXM08680.1 response regulator transcription factor [Geomonas subterranea]